MGLYEKDDALGLHNILHKARTALESDGSCLCGAHG